MQLRSYLKKSVSTGLGNTIGSALIAVVFIPLIINKIGMEAYGHWAILAIFIGISSVADLGLSKSLVYFIPRYTSQHEISEIYSAGFVLNSIIIAIVALLGITTYVLGVNIWGSEGVVSKNLGNLIFICGLIISCSSLATALYRSILEALYKIYLVNIGFFLLTMLNYMSLYALTFFTHKVEHYIISSTIVYLLVFLFHLILVRVLTQVRLHMPKLETIKFIAQKSISFFSISVLEIIIQPLNRYFVILFSGNVSIYGIFDIALKISMISLSCLQAFNTPLFSLFAGYGRNRMAEIKRILKQYLIGLGVAYMSGCTLFYFFGAFIMKVFVDIETVDLFQSSFVLILGVALFGVAEPFIRAFLALGDLKLSFNIKILQPATNFFFILLLPKLSPLYRFSSAYSLAYAITAIVYIITFLLKYDIRSEEA